MWPFKLGIQGQNLKFKISGMHCSSCAMNIDNNLEEIPGIISSQTNYAKGETEIIFAPGKSVKTLAKKAIEALGYEVIK